MAKCSKRPATAATQASVMTLGKATGELVKDLSKSLNMTTLLGGARENYNRIPKTPTITDQNIGEFVLTGNVPPKEIKEQQIAAVRARLKEQAARSKKAQQGIEKNKPEEREVVQQVLNEPLAANEIAGARKLRIPDRLGPYHVAVYRAALKKAQEQRKASQKALPMPQGRETGPNLFRIGRPRKQAQQLQHVMTETGAGKGGTINIGQ